MSRKSARGALLIQANSKLLFLRPFHTVESKSLSRNEYISSGELVPSTDTKDSPNVASEGTLEAATIDRKSGWNHGVRQFPVKDNIATIGTKTTCGSGILRKYHSPFEAHVVSLIYKGNGIVPGKTNLDEFGMGSHTTNSFFGPTHNVAPFGAYSPGGSSGGSAVAVASKACEAALGTDTGGSVRLPAAYTGIIGFKPSYGVISRWGVVPYANSLDTVGIMVSDVMRLSRIFSDLSQVDSRDPTCLSQNSRARLKTRKELAENEQQNQDPALSVSLDQSEPTKDLNDKESRLNFTIGVPIEYNIEELEPGIRQAWIDALESLQNKGCTVVPVSLPHTKHALSAYYVLAPAEAASNLSKYDGIRYGSRHSGTDGTGSVLYSETRGEGFGDEVKRRILLGSYTLSSEAVNNYFLKAQKIRRLVQRDFDRVFSTPNPLRSAEQFDLRDMDESIEMSNKLGPTQVDFIICPTAPTLPPTLHDVEKQTSVDTYMNDVFTVPASLAGLPAISVPVQIPEGFQTQGMPSFAGIQIIGQHQTDFQVIGMAEQLVKITPSNP